MTFQRPDPTVPKRSSKSPRKSPRKASAKLPADRFVNRELSWLEFNQRVLEQAANDSQPLLERLKFLAITGSNLDEFFMVRVGSLKMQSEQNPHAVDLTGTNVFDQLKAVSDRCQRLRDDQYQVLIEQLEPALSQIGVQRVDLAECGDRQGEAADRFFENEVSAVLSPQMLFEEHPFPLLPGLQVHLCARLEPLANEHQPTAGSKGGKTNSGKAKGSASSPALPKDSGEQSGEPAVPEYAIIPLGRSLPRVVSLPADNGYAYGLLEDVACESIEAFFPGRQVAECWPLRVTRNADVELREDSAADLMAGMGEVLESRKASSVIRLEIDHRASETMTEYLRSRLELEPTDVFRNAGPLDLSYLFQLSALEGFDAHRDPVWPGHGQARLDPRESMFANMVGGDVLMVHPYERFDPIVSLIEEAAQDPDVLAIKQVLYRTSRQSPIVEALMRAAERGKYVTVVVELKARFDEARNIEWAKEMEQAGVQVIYGVKGLKTHAKVCIIVRREPQGIVRYLHFGTGNYNEATARLYSDISLLTCNDELGSDASAFFNAITGSSQVQQFHQLDAAPLTLRKRLLAMIDAEAARCREGQTGRIVAKMNALVDAEIIDALYRASQAGVDIRLNIRGVCCLRPQVAGLSERIRVTSIIDRYLEHARIFFFHQGGEEALFISSADWMPRNLDRRVELMVPILDPGCKKKLWQVLDTYFHDNSYSWTMQADGSYRRLQPKAGQEEFRAQQKLYDRARQETGRAQMVRTASFVPHQPADNDE
ncbi:polyphosphate kinase 1 [Planctomycetaceae bacterium SH139]